MLCIVPNSDVPPRIVHSGLWSLVEQVNIIRIGDQLQYFREYQRKLRALVGEEQATQLVNQALVLITLGGNDFVNNYYLVPMSVRSRQYALPDYVRFLVAEYRKILSVNPRVLLLLLSGSRHRQLLID